MYPAPSKKAGSKIATALPVAISCAYHTMVITFRWYPLIITSSISCVYLQITGLEEGLRSYRSISSRLLSDIFLTKLNRFNVLSLLGRNGMSP